MRFLACLVSLMLFSNLAHADMCGPRGGAAAEAAVEHFYSWQQIADSYHKFEICDQGRVSDGFSRGIAQQLMTHWDSLPDLQRVIDADPAFKPFVLRHLNLSLNERDLAVIRVATRDHCLPSLEPLCRALGDQVKQTEKEMSDR